MKNLPTLILTAFGIAVADSNKTAVLFTNGAFTPLSMAQKEIYDRKIGIQFLLQSDTSLCGGSNDCRFILGYNQNVGYLADAKETLRQLSVSQNKRNFITRAWNHLFGRDTATAPAWSDSVQAINARRSSPGSVEQQDLDSLGVKFVTAINDGRRVLHVTHSQGGLYANSMYGDIPTHLRPYYRCLQIASPSPALPPGMDYVTFQEDRAIGLLRPVYGCLPGNIQLAPDSLLEPDLFKHQQWTYLENARARALIASKAKALMSDVAYPAFQHNPNWNESSTWITSIGGWTNQWGGNPFDVALSITKGEPVLRKDADLLFWDFSGRNHLVSPHFVGIGSAVTYIARLTTRTTPLTSIYEPDWDIGMAQMTPKQLYNAMGLRKGQDAEMVSGAYYIVRCADSTITVLRPYLIQETQRINISYRLYGSMPF